MNDKVQARKMVLVSAFLLVAVAVYRDRKTGTEGMFRALWGVGVVSLVLSLVADFAPQVAGPFAVLTVLGSLTNGGDKLIQSALGKVGTGSTTVTATGSSSQVTASSPARSTTTGGTTP